MYNLQERQFSSALTKNVSRKLGSGNLRKFHILRTKNNERLRSPLFRNEKRRLDALSPGNNIPLRFFSSLSHSSHEKALNDYVPFSELNSLEQVSRLDEELENELRSLSISAYNSYLSMNSSMQKEELGTSAIRSKLFLNWITDLSTLIERKKDEIDSLQSSPKSFYPYLKTLDSRQLAEFTVLVMINKLGNSTQSYPLNILISELGKSIDMLHSSFMVSTPIDHENFMKDMRGSMSVKFDSHIPWSTEVRHSFGLFLIESFYSIAYVPKDVEKLFKSIRESIEDNLANPLNPDKLFLAVKSSSQVGDVERALMRSPADSVSLSVEASESNEAFESKIEELLASSNGTSDIQIDPSLVLSSVSTVSSSKKLKSLIDSEIISLADPSHDHRVIVDPEIYNLTSMTSRNKPLRDLWNTSDEFVNSLSSHSFSLDRNDLITSLGDISGKGLSTSHSIAGSKLRGKQLTNSFSGLSIIQNVSHSSSSRDRGFEEDSLEDVPSDSVVPSILETVAKAEKSQIRTEITVNVPDPSAETHPQTLITKLNFSRNRLRRGVQKEIVSSHMRKSYSGSKELSSLLPTAVKQITSFHEEGLLSISGKRLVDEEYVDPRTSPRRLSRGALALARRRSALFGNNLQKLKLSSFSDFLSTNNRDSKQPVSPSPVARTLIDQLSVLLDVLNRRLRIYFESASSEVISLAAGVPMGLQSTEEVVNVALKRVNDIVEKELSILISHHLDVCSNYVFSLNSLMKSLSPFGINLTSSQIQDLLFPFGAKYKTPDRTSFFQRVKAHSGVDLSSESIVLPEKYEVIDMSLERILDRHGSIVKGSIQLDDLLHVISVDPEHIRLSPDGNVVDRQLQPYAFSASEPAVEPEIDETDTSLMEYFPQGPSVEESTGSFNVLPSLNSKDVLEDVKDDTTFQFTTSENPIVKALLGDSSSVSSEFKSNQNRSEVLSGEHSSALVVESVEKRPTPVSPFLVETLPPRMVFNRLGHLVEEAVISPVANPLKEKAFLREEVESIFNSLTPLKGYVPAFQIMSIEAFDRVGMGQIRDVFDKMESSEDSSDLLKMSDLSGLSINSVSNSRLIIMNPSLIELLFQEDFKQKKDIDLSFPVMTVPPLPWNHPNSSPYLTLRSKLIRGTIDQASLVNHALYQSQFSIIRDALLARFSMNSSVETTTPSSLPLRLEASATSFVDDMVRNSTSTSSKQKEHMTKEIISRLISKRESFLKRRGVLPAGSMVSSVSSPSSVFTPTYSLTSSVASLVCASAEEANRLETLAEPLLKKELYVPEVNNSTTGTKNIRKGSGPSLLSSGRVGGKSTGSMSPLLDSINSVSTTAWKIDPYTLDIAKSLWNGGTVTPPILSEKSITLEGMPAYMDTIEDAPPPLTEYLMEREAIIYANGKIVPTTDVRHLRSTISDWSKRHQKYLDAVASNTSERYSFSSTLDRASSAAKYPEIFFPHNFDFRGRAYPLPTLINHMTTDLPRSFLRFASGKPLGERGFHWLKVHLSNIIGNDKISFDDRSAYVDSLLPKILETARDPFSSESSDFWMRQSSPFQTLALCREIAQIVQKPSHAIPHFISHHPVHMDGSCNGLQHYAALGRDEQGGRAVNLVSNGQNKPSDVYAHVLGFVKIKLQSDAALNAPDFAYKGLRKSNALEATRFFNADSSEASWVVGSTVLNADGEPYSPEFESRSIRRFMASHLLPVVDRETVKQTVMTSVYGVKYLGARDQIRSKLEKKLLRENTPFSIEEFEFFQSVAAAYLARVVLIAIGDAFHNANEIMTWLGDLATVSSACNLPVSWVTPLALPVVQDYRRETVRTVHSAGGLSFRFSDSSAVAPLSKSKQKSAFPPNYVHSLDSTHMLLTARECAARGLSFAAVHDSYWSHAAHTDEMRDVLRDQFVQLYSRDLLGELYQNVRASLGNVDHMLPPVPELGSLDLNLVRKSDYFFG